LPLKDSLIVYEDVIKLDTSYKKEILFKSTKTWFINNSQSLNTLISYEDHPSGKIIGNAIIHIPVSLYILGYLGKKCTFSIQLDIKDGKYKYKIYDFIESIEYPHDKIVKIDVSDRYLKYLRGDYKAVGFVGKKRLSSDFDESFKNMDDQIRQLINSINVALKSGKPEDF